MTFRMLLEIFDDLGLCRDHFVIFGSAPMLLYGLKTTINDLDVVARGSAWTQAQLRFGDPRDQFASTHGTHKILRFWGDFIEVSDGWTSPAWDTRRIDDMIDDSTIVEGYRFAKLHHVLDYKCHLNRTKDQEDIDLIRCALSRSGAEHPTPHISDFDAAARRWIVAGSRGSHRGAGVRVGPDTGELVGVDLGP
ncbi:hypothetical protein LX16_0646 [Stackebrandtia albiflava]|uniref:Uncharacterized protein n=1 Tax=Stackebrandtia albiflava TaxID=406432 RepID=A0A562VAS9_9ACTN|nr:hypothetical protein [Stackebrandtia albiflava]TWJ14951.1 hypothetical protein LX16_0646 [Stackebrandtia albiflava]